MEDDKKTPNWWTTLPGILTGIAATITAFTGLLVALNQMGIAHKPVPAPSPAADSPRPAPSAFELAGRWAGSVKEEGGTGFRLEAQIDPVCKLNDRCGRIRVSQGPCNGELYLEAAGNGDYEFRVENFDDRSNRKTCKPGAGEHFRREPDGRLSYFASYSDAKGLLDRVQE